ncbi:hypothetical protein C8F01DRAFT_1083265 [Mycena amicta]|nr:hypothetical protein C8F01DRAFT_1083265 [Mycena amicta]
MSRPNAQDDDSRRTRVYVACLNCRKRKTKCITDSTADKPCMRCVQQGLKCTYAPIDHGDGASTSGSSSSQQRAPPYSNPFAPAPASAQQYSEHYGGVAQGSGMPGHGYVPQQQQLYGTQSYQQQQSGSYGSQSVPPYLQEAYTGQQGLYDQGFTQAGGYYSSGGAYPTMDTISAPGYQRYAGVGHGLTAASTDPALALQEDVLTEGDTSLPEEAGPPAEAELDAEETGEIII